MSDSESSSSDEENLEEMMRDEAFEEWKDRGMMISLMMHHYNHNVVIHTLTHKQHI